MNLKRRRSHIALAGWALALSAAGCTAVDSASAPVDAVCASLAELADAAQARDEAERRSGGYYRSMTSDAAGEALLREINVFAETEYVLVVAAYDEALDHLDDATDDAELDAAIEALRAYNDTIFGEMSQISLTATTPDDYLIRADAALGISTYSALQNDAIIASRTVLATREAHGCA